MLEIERQSYSYPWSEGIFLDCFKSSYRLWGAALEGSLVGYAIVSYILDEAHLLNLCVHPRSRGLAVGKLLLRHLTTSADREGMNQILLEDRLSNTSASQIYRTHGSAEICRSQ